MTTQTPTHCVTLHMAASLDNFIARRDGRVDWMKTADHYAAGDTLSPDDAAAFLKTIDCYVMGSRTYETALNFEAQGYGWAYGETPTYVLTRRTLPCSRSSVQFVSGDLVEVFDTQLRPRHRAIWIAGGGALAGECLRRGLVDEIRYSILPVVIGDGIRFFEGLDVDVPLHLLEMKAYTSGMVALRYQVRRA